MYKKILLVVGISFLMLNRAEASGASVKGTEAAVAGRLIINAQKNKAQKEVDKAKQAVKDPSSMPDMFNTFIQAVKEAKRYAQEQAGYEHADDEEFDKNIRAIEGFQIFVAGRAAAAVQAADPIATAAPTQRTFDPSRAEAQRSSTVDIETDGLESKELTQIGVITHAFPATYRGGKMPDYLTSKFDPSKIKEARDLFDRMKAIKGLDEEALHQRQDLIREMQKLNREAQEAAKTTSVSSEKRAQAGRVNALFVEANLLYALAITEYAEVSGDLRAVQAARGILEVMQSVVGSENSILKGYMDRVKRCKVSPRASTVAG